MAVGLQWARNLCYGCWRAVDEESLLRPLECSADEDDQRFPERKFFASSLRGFAVAVSPNSSQTDARFSLIVASKDLSPGFSFSAERSCSNSLFSSSIVVCVS